MRCATIGMFYPGMHSPEETESFERLADGVVELRGYESQDARVAKNLFQVKKMRRNTFLSERIPYSRDGWRIRFHKKNLLSAEG